MRSWNNNPRRTHFSTSILTITYQILNASTFELCSRATCTAFMRKYHYVTSSVWQCLLQLYIPFAEVIQSKHWSHKLALGTKFVHQLSWRNALKPSLLWSPAAWESASDTVFTLLTVAWLWHCYFRLFDGCPFLVWACFSQILSLGPTKLNSSSEAAPDLSHIPYLYDR